MRKLRMLIWKDYRLNRPILMFCVTALVLLYSVGAATEAASVWPKMPSAGDWGSMLVSYGTVALYLTFFFTGLGRSRHRLRAG